MPPRKLNPDIPRDLETIVLKAIGPRSGPPLPDAGRAGRRPAPLPRRPADPGPAHRSRRNRRGAGAGATPRWPRSTATAFLLMVAVTVVSVVAYAQTAAANRETADKALAAEKTQREARRERRPPWPWRPSIGSTTASPRPGWSSTPPAASDEGVELPPQPRPAAGGGAAAGRPAADLRAACPRRRASSPSCKPRRPRPITASATSAGGSAGSRTPPPPTGLPLTCTPGCSPTPARTPSASSWPGRTTNWAEHCARCSSSTRPTRMHERAIRTLTEAPRRVRRPAGVPLRTGLLVLRARPARHVPLAGGPDRDRPGRPGEPGTDRREGDPAGPPARTAARARVPEPEGDHPAAGAAVALLERLVREFPTVPEYRHLLACCYRDMPPDRSGRGGAAEAQRPIGRWTCCGNWWRTFRGCPTIVSTCARRWAVPAGRRPGGRKATRRSAKRLEEAVSCRRDWWRALSERPRLHRRPRPLPRRPRDDAVPGGKARRGGTAAPQGGGLPEPAGQAVSGGGRVPLVAGSDGTLPGQVLGDQGQLPEREAGSKPPSAGWKLVEEGRATRRRSAVPGDGLSRPCPGPDAAALRSKPRQPFAKPRNSGGIADPVHSGRATAAPDGRECERLFPGRSLPVCPPPAFWANAATVRGHRDAVAAFARTRARASAGSVAAFARTRATRQDVSRSLLPRVLANAATAPPRVLGERTLPAFWRTRLLPRVLGERGSRVLANAATASRVLANAATAANLGMPFPCLFF